MQVKVMSKNKAIEYSSEVDCKIAIVSITSEKEEDVDFIGDNIVDIFRMSFEDVESPIKNVKYAIEDDFKGLKSFVDKNINEVDEMVVHCHAGVSRSAACAGAILRYIKEDDLSVWGNKRFYPNSLVFKCCCKELGIQLTEEEISDLYKANEDAHLLDVENMNDWDLFFV